MMAHDNQRRNSILGLATILAATLMFIFASNDANTIQIQNDHRQRKLNLDPKTVIPREVAESIIDSPTNTDEKLVREETCKPHVMFSTFRCSEDSSACTPLRQRIEDNTYHVWSSFPEEVTFKVIHSSKLETNIHGVPILKDMYLNMMEECPNALTYTYINGDIIGTRNFIDSINVALSLEKEFLMVGKRTNVPWKESMDVRDENFHWTNLGGQMFKRYAEDYFTFTKNAIDWNMEIPPLVIGRSGYDNWLVDYVYHKANVVLVDASYSATMYHQSQGSNRGARGPLEEADKAYNFNLLHEAGLQVGGYGYTTNAEWQTYRHKGGQIKLRHPRGWSYEQAKKDGYDSK